METDDKLTSQCPIKDKFLTQKSLTTKSKTSKSNSTKVESKILIRTGRMTSIQSPIDLIGPLTGKGILLASELRLEITEN